MASSKQIPHRPTIKEVAKEAGVSFRTVARVANNETTVSEDRQKRVRAAMEKLGYRPNVAARQLRSHRSYLIALIFYEPEGVQHSSSAMPFFSAAQLGASRRCRKYGYNLIIEGYTPKNGEDIAERLSSINVDGVIILPPASQNADFITILRRKNLRHVLISSDLTEDNAPVITSDDEEAAYKITKSLIRLGHQKIGFIGPREQYASKLRLKGFLGALGDAGIPRNPAYEAYGQFSVRAGSRCGDKLLQLKDRPTAIVGANDSIALGIMIAAAKHNLSIPKELSITGYDDTLIATTIWPQLTTVHQPISEMASKAVDLLSSAEILGTNRELIIPSKIIRRGTTAKCNTP